VLRKLRKAIERIVADLCFPAANKPAEETQKRYNYAYATV
jgi:hypothetical protein